MASTIDLMPSHNALQAAATLANGRHISLHIEPSHAWVDPQGYIRLFTIIWSDGRLENFKLLPRHNEAWKIVEEIASFLAVYGIARGAGRLLSRAGKMIPNVAAFLLNTHGASMALREVFFKGEIRDSGYYSLETGELFIVHPLRVG